MQSPQFQQLRVLMVSDFFHPNVGGVESHIYSLSQCLMAQGHKVVVATHAYGTCSGVRYLSNGLKVYYLHRLPVYLQTTMPTVLGTLRPIRNILLREQLHLLHAHQAFSVMALEGCLHARTLGVKVVFTDHSLFGFADACSIIANKVLKCVLSDVDAVICVSHTSKENTVLRACIAPRRVSVIPNAVDTSQFTPSSKARPWPRKAGDPITIVAMSRLVYRKGIDLLACVLPVMCARFPHVDFVIGGSGPKGQLLKAVIEEHGLAQRVQLVGAVAHEDVRALLLRGHIFVNASLTEAFCISLVEAASAGLLVVSTGVGGVPEVLPSDMVLLAEPSADALLAALEEALVRVLQVQPQEQHNRVVSMYDWSDVATRTAHVYRSALSSQPDASILPRLQRYMACGTWIGSFFCFLALLATLWSWIVEQWLQPAASLQPAVDWPLRPVIQPAVPSAHDLPSAASGGERGERRHEQVAPERHHQAQPLLPAATDKVQTPMTRSRTRQGM